MKRNVYGVGIVLLLLAAVVTSRGDDYYVARNNTAPVYPYTSWAAASTNIQNAVNAAPANSTVWVAPGTYTLPTNAVAYEGVLNVVDIRKALTLRSSNGVPAQTIIDGQRRYRGLYLYPGSGVPKKIVVDGFSVTNCWATNGAAVYMGLIAGTSVVQNCTIRGNTAVTSGGGINVGPQLFVALQYVVSNCLFQGNRATNATATGGAISSFVRGSTAKSTIANCVIVSNTAGKHGGGVYLYPPPADPLGATIKNCTIKYNRSMTALTGCGAGIYCGGGNTYLHSCLLQNNGGGPGGAASGAGPGGAAYVTGGAMSLDFYNCTIVSNVGIYGSAVSANNAGTTMRSVNTIIYYDSMDPYSKVIPSYTNCCLDARITPIGGINNFTSNPQFVNANGKDFHLRRGSICINSGTNQLSWMTGKFDLDGSARIDSEIVDRGCYEYRTMGSTVTIQ